jgi:hypothetical protein
MKAPRAVIQYKMVVRLVGFGTKTHCAGGDQQQATGLDVFLDGLSKTTKNLSGVCVRVEI